VSIPTRAGARGSDTGAVDRINPSDEDIVSTWR